MHHFQSSLLDAKKVNVINKMSLAFHEMVVPNDFLGENYAFLRERIM